MVMAMILERAYGCDARVSAYFWSFRKGIEIGSLNQSLHTINISNQTTTRYIHQCCVIAESGMMFVTRAGSALHSIVNLA